MSNESKGTPKPFRSDLFSSTPSSLSGLNLGSDSKSFLGGPIPFIVPQQGGASASPAKKDENAPTEPFGSTSPSPPSPIERPASASLTQVDLSDDAPPGKEESPQHVGGGGGAAATQHHHPVFGAAAPVATSAELDLAGSRHVPVQQLLPRQHSSPPSIAATSLQPQGGSPLPPPSLGPYNPYRANPLQHQHQQRPPAPVQYPAQQFVPVAELYPSQVAPLATAVPHQHQHHDHHHDHHHGEECHHDHDHGHHEHHQHQHQHQQHGPPPVDLPSVSLHYHWFYLSPKGYWTPFSLTDSNSLEMVHASGDDIVHVLSIHPSPYSSVPLCGCGKVILYNVQTREPF
ncbi:pair-rule protein odd-paired-like [Oscarella lobularis]|uniref:pair-rule protein odd-paired-like n=1 Tax=Oscarella lobularis TaxID=121494 RepID=UPI003313EB80